MVAVTERIPIYIIYLIVSCLIEGGPFLINFQQGLSDHPTVINCRSGISVKGKNAVVVGRSNIVGLPVSLLLLKEDATVTVVHSRTKDPESIIRNADIVIAAAGQARMIKGSWIKPGAAVIDVGTNSVDDPSRKSGYRLVGDVHFDEACKALVAASAGQRPSFPVVFIGQELVGGENEVMSLHVKGKLVPLLKKAGAIWI